MSSNEKKKRKKKRKVNQEEDISPSQMASDLKQVAQLSKESMVNGAKEVGSYFKEYGPQFWSNTKTVAKDCSQVPFDYRTKSPFRIFGNIFKFAMSCI